MDGVGPNKIQKQDTETRLVGVGLADQVTEGWIAAASGLLSTVVVDGDVVDSAISFFMMLQRLVTGTRLVCRRGIEIDERMLC